MKKFGQLQRSLADEVGKLSHLKFLPVNINDKK